MLGAFRNFETRLADVCSGIDIHHDERDGAEMLDVLPLAVKNV